MTKKILAMFLAVLMVVSLLPTSVFAADAAVDCAHLHGKAHCEVVDANDLEEALKKLPTVNSTNWQMLGIVQATCQQDGGLKGRCNVCGEDFYLVITAKADATVDGQHSWKEVEAKAPNCVNKGSKAYSYCEICHAVKYAGDETVEFVENGMVKKEDKWVLTDELAAALGVAAETTSHVWSNPSEVTCVTGGKFTAVCTVCGEKEERELKAHNGQHTVASGSYKLGNKTVQCSTCYAELPVKDDEVHDCNDAWVYVDAKDATCTETGVKAYRYCAKCGAVELKTGETYAGKDGDKVYKLEDTVVAKLGHTYVEAKNALNCKSEYMRCDRCRVKADDETFKAAKDALALKGHKFAENTNWTCKTDEKHKCTVCEVEFTADEVGAERAEHKYNEADGYKSCTDKTRKCTVCEKNIEQELTKHNWSDCPSEQKATCSICEKKSNELGLYTGLHTYGDWVETKPADCLNPNEVTKTCQYCEKKITDSDVAALGHQEATLVIPGTCMKEQITYTYCTRANCPLNYTVLTDATTLSCTKDKKTYYLCIYSETYYDEDWQVDVTDYDYSWMTEAEIAEQEEYQLVKFVVENFVGTDGQNYFQLVNTSNKNALGLTTGRIDLSGEAINVLTFTTDDADRLCDTNNNCYYIPSVGSTKISAIDDETFNSEDKKEKYKDYIALDLNLSLKLKLTKEPEVGTKNGENHVNKHQVVTTEATCTTNKWVQTVCDCKHFFGAPEQVADSALGHDLYKTVNGKKVLNVTTKPTCQADGVVTCTRDNCGYTEKITLAEYQQKVDANYTGHKMPAKPEVSHEKLSAAGTIKCENENCTYTEDYTLTWDKLGKTDWNLEKANEADAHNGGLTGAEVIVKDSATCTAGGTITVKCKTCEQNVTYKTDKLGHSFTEESKATAGELADKIVTDENYKVEPTCKAEGYEYSWKCEREGCTAEHIVYDENGEKAEYIILKTVYHEYEETDAFKKLTAEQKANLNYCIENNIVARQCKYADCKDKIYAYEHIETVENKDLCSKYSYKLYLRYDGTVIIHNLVGNFGHVFQNKDEEPYEATCKHVGSHDETCVFCGKTTKVEDEMLPHMNNKGELFYNTCTDTQTNRDCELCKEPVGKDHNMKWVFHEATCEKAAYYEEICCYNDCGKKGKTMSIGTATGHTAPEDFEMPEANYDGDQKWSYNCETCDKEISGTVEQLTGLRLVADAEEYTYGSLVTITVRLDNVKKDLSGYHVGVRFNSNVLTYVGFKDLTNGEFVTKASDPDDYFDEGQIWEKDVMYVSGVYGGTGNYSIDGDIELVELYFRVTENYTQDELCNLVTINREIASYDEETGNVTFEAPDCTFIANDEDGDPKNVTFDVNEEPVVAEVRELGDFNGIAGFTIHDISGALNLIVVEGYDVAMDVNFDGKFDVIDVELLLNLINAGDHEKAAWELIAENMSEDELLRYGYSVCSDCEERWEPWYDYCPDCGGHLDHYGRW